MSGKASNFKMPARKVEEWVQGEQAAAGSKPKAPNRQVGAKVARLTIDLAPELHARFKAGCALKGTRMVDEVTRFIEEWTQKDV